MDVVAQHFGELRRHEQLQRGFPLAVQGKGRALRERRLKENGFQRDSVSLDHFLSPGAVDTLDSYEDTSRPSPRLISNDRKRGRRSTCS